MNGLEYAFEECFYKLNQDVYNRSDLIMIVSDIVMRYAFLSDSTLKQYISKIINILFIKNGQQYSRNISIHTLLRTVQPIQSDFETLIIFLIRKQKINFSIIRNKTAFFCGILTQLPQKTWITPTEFTELFNQYCKIQFGELIDYIAQNRTKIEWVNTAGLNQIIIH